MEFKEEIQNLINLKCEGNYWDYKQVWHSNNSDLLHDIICMANNLEDRDAYIIIGVTDNGDICGVSDINRKNQQQLIDFLRSKKFAGGIRPIVYVQSLEINNKAIDIIIIKNTNKTPYYLIENYEGLYSGKIYTRIVDTNTPKDSNADIDKVEWLWKKRFGLVGSITDRLRCVLCSDGWICEDKGEYNERFFNEHYLEVRIDPVISEREYWEDEEQHPVNYAHDSFFYLYANRSFWNLTGDENLRRKLYNIQWLGNIVYQFYTISAPRQPFDFVEPDSAFLNEAVGIITSDGIGLGANYAYFIKDSIKYLLFRMMRPLQADNSYMEKYGYYPGNTENALCLNVIPVFENLVEYERLMSHILENKTQFKSEFKNMNINDMFLGGEIDNDPRISQSLKLGKLMVLWQRQLKESNKT